MTKIKHWHDNLIVFLLSKEKIRGIFRKKLYLIANVISILKILKKLNGLNISKSPRPDSAKANTERVS